VTQRLLTDDECSPCASRPGVCRMMPRTSQSQPVCTLIHPSNQRPSPPIALRLITRRRPAQSELGMLTQIRGDFEVQDYGSAIAETNVKFCKR